MAAVVMSHPIWVRELKLNCSTYLGSTILTSHPIWVRELKLFRIIYPILVVPVAPHMGA